MRRQLTIRLLNGFPPDEVWSREEAIAAISGQPQRILDLGCGVGSMAFLLKLVFSQITR